jgi:hypothetical protein
MRTLALKPNHKRIPFVAAEVTRLTSKLDQAEKKDRASSRRLLQDAQAFRAYAATGQRLGDLHVNYEQAAEYPLQRIENPEEKLNWRVEKMRLTKNKPRWSITTSSPSPASPKPPSPTASATAARWNG